MTVAFVWLTAVASFVGTHRVMVERCFFALFSFIVAGETTTRGMGN